MDEPEKTETSGGMMDMVGSTRRGLSNLRGKVFHVIAGDDQLLRFKVQDNGQLFLDRQFRSLHLDNIAEVPRKIVNMPRRMLEAGKEARELVREVGKAAKGRARRKWRKVVTGDPEKRIRDHMKEVPQVKMMDKLSFTFGVLSICGLEWLALRHGELFPPAYYVIMITLMGLRLFQYAQENYHLFMLDFCYFVNLSVILQTAFFPDWILWFKANYVLTLGPLMVAIIIWKNSLVFHSLDKLTSFYLHALPPLTMHLYRFGLTKTVVIDVEETLSFSEFFLAPLGLYFSWQLGYLLLMEGPLAPALRADPDLINSLRYLAKDKKNGFRNFIILILERTGVKQRDEEFSADSVKAKVVFVISQLVYTLITILPTPFLFRSYYFSLFYFLFVFGWGTWNGASYYIEVFSERYKLKFIIKDDDEGRQSESSADNVEDEDEEDTSGNDEDQSEYESFEEALDQLDPSEHSQLCQTILQIIKDADESGQEVGMEQEVSMEPEETPAAETPAREATATEQQAVTNNQSAERLTTDNRTKEKDELKHSKGATNENNSNVTAAENTRNRTESAISGTDNTGLVAASITPTDSSATLADSSATLADVITGQSEKKEISAEIVSQLLQDAAKDRDGKSTRSTSSSESQTAAARETPDSEKSWDDLSQP